MDTAPSIFTIIKVSRDKDLKEQIGRDIYFDIVDHNKICSFHVPKDTPFTSFKDEVAKEFCIPVQFFRFWSWGKRQNGTYRPWQCLTSQQEAKSVEELRLSLGKNLGKLNLFLEVELGLDLNPTLQPAKTKDDILVFFKLYDPVKEQLRYVGRLFVKTYGKPIDILGKLNQMACFAPDEEIELYEEIFFNPRLLCPHLDKRTSFGQSEIEDGDIICFQKSPLGCEENRPYPDVPSFLEYVLNRQMQGAPDNFATTPLERSVREMAPGSCAWMIVNFSKYGTKNHSSGFVGGGYKWRLYAFRNERNRREDLCVYLHLSGSARLSSDSSITVQLNLTLVNQILRKDSITKKGEFKFCPRERDWGYPKFMPLAELYDLSKGYIVNDTVIIEAEVSVLDSLAAFEKSKNLLTELSVLKITRKPTSHSGSGTSGSSLPPSSEVLQQQRKALKYYLALSLEAIDQANGFNNIEKITLPLLQHSANSLETTILEDLMSRLAGFKVIVPATKLSIENMRAQKMSLSRKKSDVRARLYQGQQQLSSLEFKFSRLLDEERKLKAEVMYLMTEEEELCIKKSSVTLELEKMNEQVSKDLEEWRDISRETKQAAKDWLQAREKLAQAQLSWQLFKQNLELCEQQ